MSKNKLQVPNNKHQVPSTKFQITNKLQITNSKKTKSKTPRIKLKQKQRTKNKEQEKNRRIISGNNSAFNYTVEYAGGVDKGENINMDVVYVIVFELKTTTIR